MSVRIDVVNFALAIIGSKEIQSIEDDSDKARTLKSVYYIARDSTLEVAEWSFATRRFKPAKSAIAPEWGWANAYPIPPDIVRVTDVDRDLIGVAAVRDTELRRNPIPHVVEYVSGIGKAILCDEDPIFCKGVRRIDDEGIYSPLFVEAFAAKLAYLAALPITQSNNIRDNALALHVGLIRDAKSRDGMQSTTRRMRSQSLSRAR